MTVKDRHESLKLHLSEENPILLDVVDKYEILDGIGIKSGFLDEEDSYTSKISWWPIISVLGTFSAGKSTFINNYMGTKIQDSGNQAVDDKFTAICYGHSDRVTTLPGMALNADPRFPFYGISDELDKIEKGEGDRINLYMQLKTVKSDTSKGKVFIDSPGFDADSQRNTILRMTKHIIDISDIVLIFFDARHPEPGAMRDTLEHLVSTTMHHADADKVLYILNQIDTTSKEDNLEDVISSWQRSLAHEGLVTGNFYTIYNEESADAFTNEAAHSRLKTRKDAHLEKITSRIDEVGTERAYRIASMLEDVSKELRDEKFPKLKSILEGWCKKVFWTNFTLFAFILIAIVMLDATGSILSNMLVSGAILGAAAVYIHFYVKKFIAQSEIKRYAKEEPAMANAIEMNTKWFKSITAHKQKSWNSKNIHALSELIKDSKKTIQKLNDQFITAK